MQKKEFSLILLFTVLAYYLQSIILFNSDVAYHLTLTQQLWHGGKFGKDIFETNPPMIIYLYMPVYWLANYISISILTIAKIYILCLASASAALCSYLLEKMPTVLRITNRAPFFAILLFVFFILPAQEFGQREHLLVLLVMPYFLLAATPQPARPILPITILIGIVAGLGFSLKPFFLPPLIFIEIYLMFKNRAWLNWWRPETIAMAGIFIVYLVILALYQSAYYTVMLPLISHWYFDSSASSWREIISSGMFYVCILPIVYFTIFHRCKSTSTLTNILMLANAGFIFSFLIARNIWFYHCIPALSMAFINFVLLVCDNFSMQGKNQLRNNINRNIFILLVLFLPMSTIGLRYLIAYYQRENGQIDELVSYLNKYPAQTEITCFSVTRTKECYPLVFLANKKNSSRWPFFWWTRAYLKIAITGTLNSHQKTDIAFMLDTIAADLNRPKNNIVIINWLDTKNRLDNIDYVQYFMKNKAFLDAWRHYRFESEIGPYAIYIKH